MKYAREMGKMGMPELNALKRHPKSDSEANIVEILNLGIMMVTYFSQSRKPWDKDLQRLGRV